MSFIRKIKKGKNIYLALVENKRIKGKVVQKVLKYIGKEIDGGISRKVNTDDIQVASIKQYVDVLTIHKIAEILRLRDFLGGEGKYIMAFVYSHLLERPSIRKLEEWFSHTEIPALLGIKEISTMRLYETLGILNEMDFAKVEEGIYQRLKVYERNKLSAIIDVTDTYFEGGGLEGTSRRGKDGKYGKLLQIGLGVTERYGFPVVMRIYPGNISNFMIFKDLFVCLKERRFSSLIIDRGMSSEENVRRVLAAGMRIICGLKKTPFFKERYLGSLERDDIYLPRNRVRLKNTSIYIKEYSYLRGKLIVVYNPYLEVVKREMIYERQGSDDETRYVGYSFIYHNTPFSAEEVVRKYYEKEIIDRAFRKMKGILSLRPIRVWTKEHIEGHVRVCYLSYAILSLLEYYLKKFDISALELFEKLRMGYKVYLKDRKSGFSWETTVILEKKLYKILDYLGVVYKNR